MCGRPNFYPSDHHLVPKCRGGKITQNICRDCHTAIHVCFSNKQIAVKYYTVEALMSDERFSKMIAFIRRQDPGGKVHFQKTRNLWGRNG